MSNEIEFFGKTATDKVTGFTGIITGFAQYMTGCSQYCLTPKAKDGDYKDSHWFDEGRVEIKEQVLAQNSIKSEKNGCDLPSPKSY